MGAPKRKILDLEWNFWNEHNTSLFCPNDFIENWDANVQLLSIYATTNVDLCLTIIDTLLGKYLLVESIIQFDWQGNALMFVTII